MTKRLLLTLFVLAAAAGTAHGQAAEAEAAFREGQKLMADKKYAEACDRFATSQRLQPLATTKLNLADCREKNGQYSTAWGLFLEVALELKGDTARAAMLKVAKQRAADLEPRVSYLTISVPDESRVPGLVITRNGEEIDSGFWNRAMPIDGGRYEIEASAPGHEAWSTDVEIPLEKGASHVDVPKFKAILEPPPADEPPPVDEPEPVLETRTIDGPTFTGRRKLAVGVGALGVAGLVAGGVLGASAKALEADAADLCPEEACDDADEANALVSRAESRALFANLSYGVGAAAIIGAAVLWLTGAPERVTVTASPGGVAIAGSW